MRLPSSQDGEKLTFRDDFLNSFQPQLEKRFYNMNHRKLLRVSKINIFTQWRCRRLREEQNLLQGVTKIAIGILAKVGQRPECAGVVQTQL